MKITLTLGELQSLVCRAYALPVNTEISIEGTAVLKHPQYTTLLESFTRDDIIVPGGNVRAERKISGIKLLRELVTGTGKDCGLAQAKYAVEDWKNFCAYVKQYGFPPMSANDPDYGWKLKA